MDDRLNLPPNELRLGSDNARYLFRCLLQKKYSHTFLPLVLVIIFTECEVSYSHKLKVVTSIPSKHYESSAQMKISSVNMDHVECISKSVKMKSPKAMKMSCNVHIKRKSMKLKNKKMKRS